MKIPVILRLSALAMVSWATLSAAEPPASLAVKHGARLTWDFEKGKDGFTHANQISSLGTSGGCLRGTANGTDPYVHDPTMNLGIKGAMGVAVRIRFSAPGPLQLYWANEDGDYSGARMASTNIPANQWTTVWFDLSGDPDWAGKTLSKIRLDPGTSGVTFAIEHVSILDRAPLSDLSYLTQVTDFDTGLEGWSQSGHVTGFKAEDGRLKGKSSGNDPFVVGPLISFADQGGVLVHIKSSHACDARLYWATTEGGFSHGRSVNVRLDGNNYWQLLKYDLRNHPEWAGKTITRLRLDPGTASGVSFEIDNVTLVAPAALEDADGDLLTTVEEAIYGTDPAVRDSAPRRLTQEKWIGTSFDSLDALVSSVAFHGKASVRSHGTLEAGNFFADPLAPNLFATRHRGYLTAPATGYYRFWVSGVSGVELFLSTSDSKYGKRSIARLDPISGTGYGVASISGNLWDMYASQMSDEIHLEAGEKYYLEAIQTTGHIGNTHLGIAWAKPGQDREILASDHLGSYYPTADDADDDYLPDAFEIQYGLDPADNGLIDPVRQGERGDFDLDGLTNLEEYLLGTNPANSDSDGDGVSDFNEVHHYKTSPTESGFLPSAVLAEVDLIGDLLQQGLWEISGSRLVSASYRNHARWNLEIPEDGIFQLELALKMTVVTVDEATTKILAGVDGIPVGQYEIRFGPNRQALVFIDLPFLEAGTHQLDIQLAGLRAIGNLSLESMALKRPGGLDINGDGMPESHLDKLKGRSHLTVLPGASFLSPYVAEGFSPSLAAVSLKADDAVITPQPGVGKTGWSADIQLGEAPVELVATFERGGFGEQRTLTWSALDLSQSHTLQAREGDTLKFSAPITPGTRVEVTPPLGQMAQVPLVDQIGKWQFTGPGKYTLRWRDNNGLRTESFIHVHPRVFAANLVNAIKGDVREFTPAHDTRNLLPDGGGALRLVNRKPHATGENLTFAILQSGAVHLGFREPQSGRLLGLLPIEVIEFNDVLGTQDHGSFQSGDPLTQGVIYRMAFSDLPAGWTVEVSIFRAGVTFRDGTVARTYGKSDLENGILSLEMLHPVNLTGGLCHRYIIRDASGRVVW